MAKKKGGFLKVLLVGAAVAGACYYASKKKTEIPTDMDDDLDLDDDLDDVAEEKAETKRPYTNLNFSDVEAKVQTVVTKVADVATAAVEKAAPVISAAEEKVIEFFDDRKANTETATAAAEEMASESVDATPADTTPAADDAEDDDPADAVKTDDAE